MTTYAAYDAGLPCKNPNCKSHGKPHPNCQCYGDMAEGGAVEHYCSQNRAHQPDCEYFAGGGEAEDFDPDAFLASPDQTADAAQTAEPSQGDEFDPDAFLAESDAQKYSSTGQRLAAAAEGFGQGVAGPIATWAETKLGIPAEDIAGREDAHPVEHAAGQIGGLFTPFGEAALIGKAASALGDYALLGKVGKAVLSGAIQSGALQATDEITNWILGRGNPEDGAAASIAHTGIATIAGAALGAAGEKAAEFASSRLAQAAETKLATRGQYFLYGLAAAAKGTGAGELENTAKKLSADAARGLKSGHSFYNKILFLAGPAAGAEEGFREGYRKGGVGEGLTEAGSGLVKGLEHAIGAKVASKVLVPAILNVVNRGNAQGLVETMDHVSHMVAGNNAIEKVVSSTLKGAPIIGQDAYNTANVNKWIENGGSTGDVKASIENANEPAPGFAEGGEVQPKPVTNGNKGMEVHYPEQNMVLNTIKGRTSNYLMSLKPQKNAPKLAFDEEPDTTEQQRTYQRALQIAVKPLTVMHEISNGSIDPDHIKHLNSMYPELTSLLQRRVTEGITKQQIKGEKPPYVVRQGLSMLLGTALSGEMTPANIQAAQSVFAQGQQQQQASPPVKKKGSDRSTLSKSSQAFLTGPQALATRAQKA